MTFQTYLIPVAAVVGTLVAGPALAATAKATVDAAKAAGIVGEQNDGYLGFVKGGGGEPAVEAAVGEINAGRAQLYRGAAAKNGVTPEAAGAAAYQGVVQLKLRPGDYYQTPAGEWVQK
ncbi:MAG: YdbL family protein [Phenylobacterium sp.]|uniref:YdbL family protein n=1 Tax=Phenylobacterium sp. TaxID=1871053 RepID=UPI002716C0C9|nr:YdbL family protein [Phenylobacterium sp.]MDO8914038.1 YdbL family protein [Phenylobacterium sp.]MDP3102670.1 YdbL family protein [Phenylobacterium sp.]HQT52119.1 YdbL family protein [Phenylobacterium sp.]